MKNMISKELFTEQYASASGLEVSELLKLKKAVLCDCGEIGCYGWKMVESDEEAQAIKDFLNINNKLVVPASRLPPPPEVLASVLEVKK